jgi:protein-tyrosine phosphatase
LFVCLGNICRSPLAHVVLQAKVSGRNLEHRVLVDSCGTGGWHVGGGADPGSVAVARRHGLDLSGHSARQLRRSDAEDFDWWVCMDGSNAQNTRRKLGPAAGRIVLLRDYDPDGKGDVPDPWARGPAAFDEVYQIVERSCERLLDAILGEASS